MAPIQESDRRSGLPVAPALNTGPTKIDILSAIIDFLNKPIENHDNPIEIFCSDGVYISSMANCGIISL